MIQLSGPLMVSIQITDSCNCNCVYCYNIFRENRYISVDDFEKVLTELKDVFHMVIEGGEPLLHENVFDFCDKIESSCIDYTIITNGTLITKSIAKRLSKLRCNVIVSIDSHEKDINDKTRDNYDKAMQGVINLSQSQKAFGVNTVITKHNVDSCSELIDVLYPHAKTFSFLRLIPRIDNDHKVNDLLSYTNSQINNLGLRLKDIKIKYPDVSIISPFNFPSPNNHCFNESLDVPGCLAGATYITIKPNLDVVPCSYCQSISIGNLKKFSLKSIWNSSKVKRLRENDEIPCLMVRSI